MKSFEFRLERVLKWKQQRERLAELRQKQARMVLDTASATVTMLHNRLAQAALAMQTRVGQPVSPAAWIAQYHHVAQIGQALETAEVKARQAADALHQADAQRAKISTEVEALLHLRKRQHELHEIEVARLEQYLLDEIGVRRWLAKSAAEKEVDVS